MVHARLVGCGTGTGGYTMLLIARIKASDTILMAHHAQAMASDWAAGIVQPRGSRQRAKQLLLLPGEARGGRAVTSTIA